MASALEIYVLLGAETDDTSHSPCAVVVVFCLFVSTRTRKHSVDVLSHSILRHS